MVKNPMQKRATNAFLLGMMITLIIVGIIGGLVYMLIIYPKQSTKNGSSVSITVKNVCVLEQPVKSGEQIMIGVNAKMQKIETGLMDGDSVDPVGAKAKIDLPAGTIITSSMLMAGDAPTNDVRLVEYNMITLPIGLTIGDYVDIRLTVPSGQDYIVISKKPVISINGETISFNLSEDEILAINSAIIEAYTMKASNIYVAKYVEVIQEKAIPTYPVSSDVKALIAVNPNIVAEAKENFAKRYNSGARAYIDRDRKKYEEDQKENIEEKLAEQIQKAKEARQQYLTGIY